MNEHQITFIPSINAVSQVLAQSKQERQNEKLKDKVHRLSVEVILSFLLIILIKDY